MTVKKKKVLFTSHTANFQKFNRPFMRWFRDQGWEVHYASMGEEQVLDCDQAFTVPFTRSPFKFISNFRAYRQLRRIIDSENYDIIHTHTPMGSVVTRLAARAARKRGTRVIYTAHGFHFFTGAPLINWLIYYPVERYMACHTDTLITINKEDYARAKSQFKTRVEYVPGVGIDPKKFNFKMTKAEKSKLRKSLGLKDSDFVMIYVAEISKRKNQIWLVRTLETFVKQHADAQLLLVGSDSLNGKVHRLVEKLELSNNVHFTSYRNDIPQLMKMSDIAVSSSTQEGLPVNIMEAMYLELPIVASDCRGNRDLLRKETGLVKQNDTVSYCKLIEKIRTNSKLRQECSDLFRIQSKKFLIGDIVKTHAFIYAVDIPPRQRGTRA